MVRLLALLACGFSLVAQDRWTEFRSGPFQVWTSAGERPGKETLGRLEQFRWALGKSLGHDDLESVWPIRFLVFKKYAGPVALLLDRDTYTAALVAGAPIPPAMLRECAGILIESSVGRLPQPIERGTAELFSTIEVRGTHVTLGTPPPPAERNRDWARMHLLIVSPDYYGKMPVLIHNLEQAMETDSAYRNAFGKTAQEIERLTDAYVTAGRFETTEFGGKPLNPERDFPARPVDPALAAAAVADLAFTREAYAAVLAKYPNSAGAHEGLGLVALSGDGVLNPRLRSTQSGIEYSVPGKQPDTARKELAAAVEAASTSARAWLEFARLATDRTKARAALDKAAQLNPKWAEPWMQMAAQAPDAASKIKFLKNATRIAPRNASYWRALAEADVAASDYADAGKAWAGAVRAAADDAERARMIKARTDVEQERVDYEAAERRRQAAEKEREIQNLKNAALQRIREKEAETNQSLAAGKAPMTGKVVPWWDGPEPKGKVTGLLLRVECLGKQARLTIQGEDKKFTRLLVPDASQLVVLNSDAALGCGDQRPRRKVTVGYTPKSDAKMGTAGEAARVEFAQ